MAHSIEFQLAEENADLKERNARLVAALEEIIKSNPVSGRLETAATRIAREALAQQSTEKP